MFADIVRFRHNGNPIAINRTNIFSVVIGSTWNGSLSPTSTNTSVYIRTIGSHESECFSFNTSAQALEVFELLVNGGTIIQTEDVAQAPATPSLLSTTPSTQMPAQANGSTGSVLTSSSYGSPYQVRTEDYSAEEWR